jgi:hypothetical protein
MTALHDRASLADRATATYAPEQLGRTQYMTPEGYLCCEGVRLARTGPMLYAHHEMPEIEPAASGAMITVLRDADVLFAPETILSFAGKDVTNDHPVRMVDGQTYKAVSVGTVLNPRRGEGIEADYLVGDLLIKDPDAIEAVRSKKKREVSCGYDAEVEQISPGLGRQTKVEGNHVALVKQGRAGPSCAIQDGDTPMAAKPKRTVLDRLRTAFKAKDEAAFEEELTNAQEAMDDDDADPQTIVIKVEAAPAPAAAAAEPVVDDETDPNEARFKKLEDAVTSIGEAVSKLAAPKADEKPEGEDTDEDEKKESEKTEAMDAIAKAEILAPGVSLPKMDGASPVTKGHITALRRDALRLAIADAGRKPHVEAVLAGREPKFDAMAPGEVRMVFDAASAVAKISNTASRNRPADIPQGRMTPAKLQKLNDERNGRAKRA